MDIKHELSRIAKELTASDYIHDPEHKKSPGAGWFKTNKGWTKKQKGSKPSERNRFKSMTDSEIKDEMRKINSSGTSYLSSSEKKDLLGKIKEKADETQKKLDEHVKTIPSWAVGKYSKYGAILKDILREYNGVIKKLQS